MCMCTPPSLFLLKLNCCILLVQTVTLSNEIIRKQVLQVPVLGLWWCDVLVFSQNGICTSEAPNACTARIICAVCMVVVPVCMFWGRSQHTSGHLGFMGCTMDITEFVLERKLPAHLNSKQEGELEHLEGGGGGARGRSTRPAGRRARLTPELCRSCPQPLPASGGGLQWGPLSGAYEHSPRRLRLPAAADAGQAY
mmetsp:Transcript_8870/g.15823  ORF Transcript_8870/g.15823 Transcript_8870/m.15823 type:complete len:196 (-) Transcript_8870:491-1078(-)